MSCKPVVYGPMWQYECGCCRELSDCYDTEQEVLEAVEKHDCLNHLKYKIPEDLLKKIVEQEIKKRLSQQ